MSHVLQGVVARLPVALPLLVVFLPLLVFLQLPALQLVFLQLLLRMVVRQPVVLPTLRVVRRRPVLPKCSGCFRVPPSILRRILQSTAALPLAAEGHQMGRPYQTPQELTEPQQTEPSQTEPQQTEPDQTAPLAVAEEVVAAGDAEVHRTQRARPTQRTERQVLAPPGDHRRPLRSRVVIMPVNGKLRGAA
jgi:hypothetical protein